MIYTRAIGINVLRMVWILMVGLLVGCQPETPLPTAIILPSETPTLTPSPSYTPSRTPTPYMPPTPSPTEFFGRTVEVGPGKGLLRVMNLTNSADPIDFYLDEVPFIVGLRQATISGQAAILPGTYTAQLTTDGTGSSQELTIHPDQNIDVLTVGSGDTREFVTISQPTAPLSAGEVWLSFANTIPNLEAITITLDDTTAATLNGFSASEPAIASAGDKLLRATAGDLTLIEEQITLRELTLYTFILAQNPTTGDVQLQRLEAPVLGRYMMRVVNLSAESREVDIYLNDVLLEANIGMGVSTAPSEVVTGAQRLSVYTAGADRGASMPLVGSHVFNGQAGSSIILLLTGPAAAVQVTAFEVDLDPVPERKSRVVFFNSTENTSALVAGTGGQNFEDFRPLGIGQFSEAIFFDQDEVNFTFSDADNPDIPIVESKVIPITAGQSILYAVTGRDDVLSPVYGYPVEQSAALNDDGSAIPESRLRFVNALSEGISIDIYVNGILNMPMMFSDVGGPLSPVLGDGFDLLVRQAGNGPALLDIRLPIPQPGDYSVFLYGSQIDGLQAILIDDSRLQINEDVGTLRLVNLSNDPVDIYSLGYYVYPLDVTPIAPTETPFPTMTPTLDPVFPATPAPTLEPMTVPQDVRRILREVMPRTASNQNIAPQTFFDLTLIDASNRILGVLKALKIPAGQHYDIVAYTYRTASGVKTSLFIAPYPPR